MESPIRNCIETAKPHIPNCAEDAEKEYQKMQESIQYRDDVISGLQQKIYSFETDVIHARRVADERQEMIGELSAEIINVKAHEKSCRKVMCDLIDYFNKTTQDERVSSEIIEIVRGVPNG